MKRRKLLLGSAALFGAGGFVTGTNAFSTAEVERGIYIDVVEDGDAMLQLKYPPQEIECDGDVQLVEIGNLTGNELTSVTVSVDSTTKITLDTDEDISVVDDDDTDTLPEGDSVSVTVPVEVAEGFTGIGGVDFHVAAIGEGVSIETTEPRTVDIDATCEEEDDELDAGDVKFQQQGKKVTFEMGLSEPVVVWYESDGDIDSEEIELSGDEINRGKLNVRGNYNIIAVEVRGVLFISPHWLEEETNKGFSKACKVDDFADAKEVLSDEEELVKVCD